jgi:hypothetical protein
VKTCCGWACHAVSPWCCKRTKESHHYHKFKASLQQRSPLTVSPQVSVLVGPSTRPSSERSYCDIVNVTRRRLLPSLLATQRISVTTDMVRLVLGSAKISSTSGFGNDASAQAADKGLGLPQVGLPALAVLGGQDASLLWGGGVQGVIVLLAVAPCGGDGSVVKTLKLHTSTSAPVPNDLLTCCPRRRTRCWSQSRRPLLCRLAD